MALTMAVSTAGLWVLGSPYPIILGMVIGLLDALPVLGTGTVFVPWALVLAAGGRVGPGGGIFWPCIWPATSCGNLWRPESWEMRSD